MVVSSVIRTLGLFHTGKIFIDPRWETADVFAYSVAEPGTYSLVAGFLLYKALGRYFKRERIQKLLVLFKFRSERSSQSFKDVGPLEDPRDINGKIGKPVRAFDSIMLSEREREMKTETKNDSARSFA